MAEAQNEAAKNHSVDVRRDGDKVNEEWVATPASSLSGTEPGVSGELPLPAAAEERLRMLEEYAASARRNMSRLTG